MGAIDPSTERLSERLGAWIEDDAPKTLGGLIGAFGADSFAVVFVMLMALPALPLPTGGVSHLLEVITMLLALELIAGRHTIWVPARWKAKELRALSNPKLLPVLVGRIAWLEQRSRPRLSHLLQAQLARSAFGVAVLVLAATAFLAPPFSGLDTLPSLGLVILSLGMLLGDAVIVAVGAVIGAVSIGVVIGLAHLVLRLL
jgi:hypothetical protein